MDTKDAVVSKASDVSEAASSTLSQGKQQAAAAVHSVQDTAADKTRQVGA